MARKKLGTMLIESGAITEQSLRVALNEQKRWGGTLGRTLIEMKLVSEAELVRVLALQLNIPTIDLEALTEIPQAVLDLVPGELAEQNALLPFAQPMKFLDVAMADPSNEGIVDELRIRTKLNIRPYIAGPRMIERAIAKYYQRGFARYQRTDVALEMNTGDSLPLEPSTDAPVEHEGIRPYPRQGAAPNNAELASLQERISQLEALVARDEGVLRKVLALLVEKGVATREEILDRIK
jgi:type IV pilus assembly protein PilB